jgi:hypothetical protein
VIAAARTWINPTPRLPACRIIGLPRPGQLQIGSEPRPASEINVQFPTLR